MKIARRTATSLRVPQRLRLTTLGELALVTIPGGEVVPGSQRRKLALLAYLALTRQPVSRDTLIATFWPDEPADRARHSLSNALSYLRGAIGQSAITVRQLEISLAPDTSLDVDAVALLAAADARDSAAVTELCTGTFMDGVYVAKSGLFHEWVAGERARIENAVVAAYDALCYVAAKQADWARCASIARRWIELAPTSTDAALQLLNSLRASRTPEGHRAALAEYRQLESRLRRDYDSAPDRRVTELASQIAARIEETRATIELTQPSVPGMRVRWRRVVVAITLAVLLVAGGVLAQSARFEAPAAAGAGP